MVQKTKVLSIHQDKQSFSTRSRFSGALSTDTFDFGAAGIDLTLRILGTGGGTSKGVDTFVEQAKRVRTTDRGFALRIILARAGACAGDLADACDTEALGGASWDGAFNVASAGSGAHGGITAEVVDAGGPCRTKARGAVSVDQTGERAVGIAALAVDAGDVGLAVEGATIRVFGAGGGAGGEALALDAFGIVPAGGAATIPIGLADRGAGGCLACALEAELALSADGRGTIDILGTGARAARRLTAGVVTAGEVAPWCCSTVVVVQASRGAATLGTYTVEAELSPSTILNGTIAILGTRGRAGTIDVGLPIAIVVFAVALSGLRCHFTFAGTVFTVFAKLKARFADPLAEGRRGSGVGALFA